MQAERGHWGSGLPERAVGGPHLPGPPPIGPGQMLPGLGGGQLPGLGSGQLPGLGGGQFPGLGGAQIPGLGGDQPPRPPLVILLTISIFWFMDQNSIVCCTVSHTP